MHFLREVRTKWPLLCRKCTVPRGIGGLIFFTVLYNEYISYIMKSFWWTSLHINSSHSSEQLKVLFVADPQLIGLRDEGRAVGPITRWDADRYVRRTFRQAYGHVQPDVIVYLGDLLDEGTKASVEEYESYMKRFEDIFYTPNHVKHIYIPGDNDVGGEGADLKNKHKTDRFKKYFNKLEAEELDTGLTSVKFLDFFKLDFDLGNTWDGQTRRRVEQSVSLFRGTYHVLMNHMSLLNRGDISYQPILKETEASIVFTAHSHKAKIHRCLNCLDDNPPRQGSGHGYPWKGSTEVLTDNQVHVFNLKDHAVVHEVVVPTCSYRMGVPEMGYGAAIFDEKGTVVYTVLWTPDRYFQLFTYIPVIVLTVALSITHFLRWVIFPLCCLRSTSNGGPLYNV